MATIGKLDDGICLQRLTAWIDWVGRWVGQHFPAAPHGRFPAVSTTRPDYLEAFLYDPPFMPEQSPKNFAQKIVYVP